MTSRNHSFCDDAISVEMKVRLREALSKRVHENIKTF